MNLFMYGTDTVANKEAWANPFVSSLALDNLVGIVNGSDDGSTDGVYKKYADSWGVNTLPQFVAAVAVQNAIVNLNKDITLAANLSIANGVTIHYNALVLTWGIYEITTTAANTVTREVVTVLAGSSQSSQAALVAVPASALIQLVATTTMTTTGGTGDGAVSYLTTTPLICSVTGAGVVTALTVGSCLITATKAASGNLFAATSSVIAITTSDSVAVAAAEKVIADKAAADKVIADKVAADKESGGGTAIAVAALDTLRYVAIVASKTIYVDLADKYAGQTVVVDVKMSVVKNGKSVLSYVPVKTVKLSALGRATVKTTLAIKAGNQIRVSILKKPTNTPIKYLTVK
jgi:hypothetical protein